MSQNSILPTELSRLITKAIADAGGWIGFDTFMALALYAPGLGYYTNDLRKFGLMPGGQAGAGSDFVTAPELSPYFGRTLARQVAQALSATGTTEVWEFGAGSGALAEQLLQTLQTLNMPLTRYTIVDVSGTLVARQRERLAAYGSTVQWATTLPAAMRGVVVGNEVLDAMPVKLIARVNGVWHERGVVRHEGRFVHADKPTALRAPVEVPGTHDYLSEIHPQAEGFMRTLADRLVQGAVLLVDYGFAEHEYYHPQRSTGTVMCHQGHLADGDALVDVGRKDITAHVNFTGVALAAQDAGLQVLGYTSQGRFLLNAGLVEGAENATLAERAMLQKLVNEHEMGELFKVMAFAAKSSNGADWSPLGFAVGDRSHTL